MYNLTVKCDCAFKVHVRQQKQLMAVKQSFHVNNTAKEYHYYRSLKKTEIVLVQQAHTSISCSYMFSRF